MEKEEERSNSSKKSKVPSNIKVYSNKADGSSSEQDESSVEEKEVKRKRPGRPKGSKNKSTSVDKSLKRPSLEKTDGGRIYKIKKRPGRPRRIISLSEPEIIETRT